MAVPNHMFRSGQKHKATGWMLDRAAGVAKCIRMDIMPERVLNADNRMNLLLSSVY